MIVHTPHKRFLLFSFSEYYPQGGIADLMSDFHSLDEFEEYIKIPENRDRLGEYTYLYDRLNGVYCWDFDDGLRVTSTGIKIIYK